MKYFYLITLLFLSINSFSQEEAKKTIIVSNDSLNGKEKEVTFKVIEDIPLAPGCEQVEKSKRMECFNLFLMEHIKRNFRYPEEARNKYIQGRVYIEITINNEGFVDKIRTRGPHKILEDEARRIMSLLPRFTPGYQNGKPISVKNTFPIVFKL